METTTTVGAYATVPFELWESTQAELAGLRAVADAARVVQDKVDRLTHDGDYMTLDFRRLAAALGVLDEGRERSWLSYDEDTGDEAG